MSVSFAPSPERLTDEGWLKTTLNYGVEVHVLGVIIDGLSLEMSAGGTDTALFDPANPPEGFTLCHNGHCHAEDGSLVPYEEVATMTGAVEAGGGFSLHIPSDGDEADAAKEDAVTLDDCPDDCTLPRGRLANAASRITQLRVQATIHDLLPPDQARLPMGGLMVEETWAVETDAVAIVDVAFGKQEKVGAALDVRLDLGDSLFDGIDWSDNALDLGELVQASLAESVTLTVEIDRY